MSQPITRLTSAKKTMIFSATAAQSTPFNKGGKAAVGIGFDSGTSVTYTVQCSFDNVAWYTAQTAAGVNYTVVASQGQCVSLDVNIIAAFTYVRLVSGGGEQTGCAADTA